MFLIHGEKNTNFNYTSTVQGMNHLGSKLEGPGICPYLEDGLPVDVSV